MDVDLMWWLTRSLFVGGGIAGAGLALLYTLQEKLIYVPRLPGLPNPYVYTPTRFGLQYEDVHFKAKDGTKLHGWMLYPQDWKRGAMRKRPTVLFFQENAGNMNMRLPYLRLLILSLNCSVFAPSYRGYGQSSGSPSEAGLKQDAEASLETLLQRQDVNPSKIVCLGKSLGGAVGIDLTAKHKDKFAAAVFENTFTSITDVAPKVLPFLKHLIGQGRPANWLIRNKWNSLEQIPKLQGLPLLLMSSLQDELLPPAQMQQLYKAVTASGSKDCTWVEFEDAGHMDAYEVAQQEYWPALMQFFKRHGLGQDHWDAPADDDIDDKEAYDSADESAEVIEDSQQQGNGLTHRAGAAAVQKAAQEPGSSVHVNGVSAKTS
ncbi:hypothetical protein WJX73_000425 [Symbiochloris irregularis]|uniref:Peptidase S9 prolyl oligopeptidase catalytic domain-containing protein n=1 Tax=Symbiochloris irregularis TaxID=706552 RepID=A0AAW1PQL1_9CHLO